MAIRRITELDNISIDLETLKNELLSTDTIGCFEFIPVDEMDTPFAKYVFETSEFNIEADGSTYYISKQLSYIDLANIINLQTNSNLDYILTGDTVFSGDKIFTDIISCNAENNYINGLSVNILSAKTISSDYIFINVDEDEVKISYIPFLSCSTISMDGELKIDSSISCGGDISCAGNISCTGDISCIGDISCAGDISCELLYGVALSAKWADLAEFYESDKDYEPGTLVKFGGEKEITLADTDVNAVITTAPGLVLNGGKQENKIMKGIALVGRVPVKIVGEIHKFDNITLSKQYPGYATRANLGDVVIGKALGTNLIPGYNLIECIVKMVF